VKKLNLFGKGSVRILEWPS